MALLRGCAALGVIVSLTLPCATSGGETGVLKSPVAVRCYPEPGKVVVSIDVPLPSGVPEDAAWELGVTLLNKDGEPLGQVRQQTGPGSREEVILDADRLPAGEYAVEVKLEGAQGVSFEAARQAVRWSGRSPNFEGIRILNNLVWQLLDEERRSEKSLAGDHLIRLPYDRWVFLRAEADRNVSGDIAIVLSVGDREIPLLFFSKGTGGIQEKMVFIRAGQHKVRVAGGGVAGLKRLIVRAVPELQHSRYPTAVPYVDQGVKYDWDYLKRHVLAHVNTIITTSPTEEAETHLREWKGQGGKIIAYTGRPRFLGREDVEKGVEACVEYWANHLGYKSPLLDGVLVDEFYHDEDPAYPVYAEAVRMLNAKFPGKAFYPYAAGRFGKDQGSVPFAAACLEGGGYICWEAYLAEWPTLKSALNALRKYPYEHIIPLEEKLPGATRRLVWVFGVFSFPWPYADGYASVNFNVYLDMQFQFIATHPALFGLGGIHIWRSGYCDEERLRWCARLFRHYAIEGATSRLSRDPYRLVHIENPDFVDGLNGWETVAADTGTISAGQERGFGRFIGRYYRGPDSFAITERRANKPNEIRQVIRNLEPGRLYSVKMLTGDYGAFRQGESKRELHAVSLSVASAEIPNGPRYRYQQAFPTRESLGTFTEARPFWLNYHWLVFRATGPTAELRISDWKSPNQPGGPVGQKLL